MKKKATAWSLPSSGNMSRAMDAHESEVATWNYCQIHTCHAFLARPRLHHRLLTLCPRAAACTSRMQ